MMDVPDGYADAVVSTDRTIDVYISIGTGIDTTAADDITTVTGSFLPMSNTAQLADAIYYITDGLATFEGDGIPTSGTAIVPPAVPTDYPPETGIWSSGISDASGNISFSLTIQLAKAHSSALRVYTGVKVMAATATFYNGSASTAKTFACSDDWMEIADVMTYDRIVISVTKISGAYRHVRIVECEFGASVALSKTEIGGEVVLIREADPTESTMPVDELDISVLNVSGAFDTDNPSTRLGELAIGYPVWLSFTVNKADGTRFTVQHGRYWIGQLDSSDTRLNITAFDARHTLADMSIAWSIPAEQSVGKAIDDLLTDIGIPHTVEADIFQLMPDATVSFGSDTTLAEDLIKVTQAYGINLIPDRQGSIIVTRTWPAGTYGAVPYDTVYSWPSPKQSTRYNVVTVAYGTAKTDVVETDLRTDPSESRVALMISDNPMITTEARATATMNRLVGRISAETSEAEWRGDPAMDLGDTVQIPGRWTQDSPRSYKATYIEETYDGTYRAIIRGTR